MVYSADLNPGNSKYGLFSNPIIIKIRTIKSRFRMTQNMMKIYMSALALLHVTKLRWACVQMRLLSLGDFRMSKMFR